MSNYSTFQDPSAGPVDASNPNGKTEPQTQEDPNGIGNHRPFIPMGESTARQHIRRLIWVEIGLSLAIIVLQVGISIAVGSVFVFGIVVGILGLITAGLAYGNFRTRYDNCCFVVFHHIVRGFSAVNDMFFCIISGLVIFDGLSSTSLKTAESFLLTAAIAHFITLCVSAVFTWRAALPAHVARRVRMETAVEEEARRYLEAN